MLIASEMLFLLVPSSAHDESINVQESKCTGARFFAASNGNPYEDAIAYLSVIYV